MKRHAADIAEQTKIPLKNLQWYGAFHDTTHHPHIHLIVYSSDSKQGFLTRQGIDKIRSRLANDIFHDELQSLYQEQTVRRDELKQESKRQVKNIVAALRNASFENPELELLVRKLQEQLKTVSGKKVYGYLPKSVKETVNAIFTEISRNPSIDLIYEKWCELERQKYKTYTQKEKDFPPLTENKVFHSIRNEIIRQVLNADVDVQHDHSVENLLPRDNSVHLSSTAFGLLNAVAGCIRDDYNQRFHSNRAIVDRKLRRLIREKKQAQGLQYEPEQSQEY